MTFVTILGVTEISYSFRLVLEGKTKEIPESAKLRVFRKVFRNSMEHLSNDQRAKNKSKIKEQEQDQDQRRAKNKSKIKEQEQSADKLAEDAFYPENMDEFVKGLKCPSIKDVAI